MQHNFVYNIGDLVCCPRSHVQDMWGTCIVMGSGSINTHLPSGKDFHYYNIYSPVRQRTVQMPAIVLEDSWYIPGNEKELKNGKDS